jgi:minor histocompatibility antigen H13
LLIGLFLYDIFFVFGTDIMMTVATKVEAPVKILFPASLSMIESRPYPFSVLGLGDLVVPGVMAALARRLDLEAASNLTEGKIDRKTIFKGVSAKAKASELPSKPTEKRYSYLDSSVVGYVGGLVMAFAANEWSHHGQPALLYLVPCAISTMLYTAIKNKELSTLWGNGLGNIRR